MVGYDFFTVDLAKYSLVKKAQPAWGKIPAILETFEKYPGAEWIWWLDVDAIIMTPEIDLFEHILDPNVLRSRVLEGEPIVILGQDYTAVNSGLVTTVNILLESLKFDG